MEIDFPESIVGKIALRQAPAWLYVAERGDPPPTVLSISSSTFYKLFLSLRLYKQSVMYKL